MVICKKSFPGLHFFNIADADLQQKITWRKYCFYIYNMAWVCTDVLWVNYFIPSAYEIIL